MSKKSNYLSVVFSILVGGTVFAQPPGIVLQPGEVYVPGSLRDQNGNPVPDYANPPLPPGMGHPPGMHYPGMRPPWMPPHHPHPPVDVNHDFDRPYPHQVRNRVFRWDQHLQRWVVDEHPPIITDSGIDMHGDVVDPGSVRRVDRMEADANGVIWHITGRYWTSRGVPHVLLQRHVRNSTDSIY